MSGQQEQQQQQQTESFTMWCRLENNKDWYEGMSHHHNKHYYEGWITSYFTRETVALCFGAQQTYGLDTHSSLV